MVFTRRFDPQSKGCASSATAVTDASSPHSSLPSSTKVSLSLDDLSTSRTGWIGRHVMTQSRNLLTLEGVRAQGTRVHKWDGRTEHVILDRKGRIIVILAGAPSQLPVDSHPSAEPSQLPFDSSQKSWNDIVHTVEGLMTEARKRGMRNGAFMESHGSHRRGAYYALPCGISHGGGQQEPGNLVQTKGRTELLDVLLGSPDVAQVAAFQSASLAKFAPRIYEDMSKYLARLYLRINSECLRTNFASSIYPAATFNLGPASISLEHTDGLNAPFSMCALTAFGTFDPQRGGHLMLFDLDLAIEFPPGSTILIPSSLLRHGNVNIQSGEERQSITQYCAGGLFRWVTYGYRTAKSISEADPMHGERLLRTLDGSGAKRRSRGLRLFSTLRKLENDRKAMFSGLGCD